MKTAVLLFIFTLTFASCNKEEYINIEDVQITQTAWEGRYNFQANPDNIRNTEGKIQLCFVSDEKGNSSMECFGENDQELFYYTRNKNQITITWSYLLQGTWLMAPTGKNSIRLTRYKSYEKADVIELERVDNQ